MGCTVLLWIVLAFVAAQNANEPNGPDAINAIVRTAKLKEAAGEYAAARVLIEQALAESPDSPDLLDALGSIQQDMGDYVQAERSYMRGINASARIAAGRARIRLLNNLATLYLDTLQYSKCNRLRALLEEVPSSELENSPEYAGAILSTLAMIRHAQGQDVEAERLYVQSMEWWKRVGKRVPAKIAEVKGNLAKFYLDNGRLQAAAALFEEAVTEIQGSLGSDHPSLTWPLCGLAEAKSRAGAPDRAEPLAQRAVDIARRRLGPDHPHTAFAMLIQAHAVRKLGRKHEARTLEREAKAVLRNNPEWNLAGKTVDIRTLSAEAGK